MLFQQLVDISSVGCEVKVHVSGVIKSSATMRFASVNRKFAVNESCNALYPPFLIDSLFPCGEEREQYEVSN